MIEAWTIDESTPFHEHFEEALLQEAYMPDVLDIVTRLMQDVIKRPTAYEHVVFEGEFVYIAKTGPIYATTTVPPLLVAYMTVPRVHRVYPLHVCRAATIGKPDPSDAFDGFGPDHSDAPLPERAERAVERAVRRVRRRNNH